MLPQRTNAPLSKLPFPPPVRRTLSPRTTDLTMRRTPLVACAVQHISTRGSPPEIEPSVRLLAISCSPFHPTGVVPGAGAVAAALVRPWRGARCGDASSAAVRVLTLLCAGPVLLLTEKPAMLLKLVVVANTMGGSSAQPCAQQRGRVEGVMMGQQRRRGARPGARGGARPGACAMLSPHLLGRQRAGWLH